MSPPETADRRAVFERVRQLLGETLQKDPSSIRPQDHLRDDLGVESVDFLTLVFELEDAFGRPLEDDELAELDTVESVVDLLTGDGGPASPDRGPVA